MTTVPFCPYVGLQPYTEVERAYFFGRDRDVRVICSNLDAAPLTVLYGASGVGKSSVLLAGVVPRLRQGARTAVVTFREWQSATFLPTLKSICLEAIEATHGKSLGTDPKLPLDELLFNACQILGGPVFILLDQFEEYSLYHPESDVGNTFDAEFARAVNREEVNANFLVALREDGLSQLDRFRTRIPNLLGNRLRLRHLNTAGAEQAIRKPLDVYNDRYPTNPMTIDDKLVIEVLAKARPGSAQLFQTAGSEQLAEDGDQIETPFLQLVMTRLWEAEQHSSSHELRLSTLQQLGGAERIARSYLDDVMKALTHPQQELCATLFDRLVTRGGRKIAYSVGELTGFAPEEAVEKVRAVLKRLSDARILRTLPGQGEAGYEIFHDVLGPAVLDWRARHVQAEAAQQAAEAAEKREREAAAKREKEAAEEAKREKEAIEAKAKREREDAAEKTDRSKQQMRLKSLLAIATSSALGFVVSIILAAVAWNQASIAKHETDEAQRAGEKTKEAVLKFLKKSTSSDTAIGIRAWEEDFDARDHGGWARSIDHTSIWHDAVALWVRALETEPTNAQASSLLYDTLQREAHFKVLLPTESHSHHSIAEDQISPDGALSYKLGGPEIDDGERIWFAQIVDAKTGNELSEKLKHRRTINTARFSPDGKRIVTASQDGTARVWGVETSTPLGEEMRHGRAVVNARFSPDGARVVTASWDYTAQIWDATTGTAVGKPLKHDADVWDARFSPDGRWVVTASYDNTARVWDAETGSPVFEPMRHRNGVKLASFDHKGSRIITTTYGGTASGWDAIADFVWEVPVDVLPCIPLRHADSTRYATFGSNSKKVFTASEVGYDKCNWRLWNAESGELSSVSSEQDGVVVGACFVLDGVRVVTRNFPSPSLPDDESSLLRVYDGLKEEALGKTVILKSMFWDARFSANGQLLVTACGLPPMPGTPGSGSATIWDVMSGRDLGNFSHDEAVLSATFSTDGISALTACADGYARIWDVAKNEIEKPVFHHGDLLRSARFKADGTQIVTAGNDASAQVWDTVSGAAIGNRMRHGSSVTEAIFSPDGKQVITGSDDNTARMWDASTGQPLGQPFQLEGSVVSVDFNSDGSQIITANEGKNRQGGRIVRVWDVPTSVVRREIAKTSGPILAWALAVSGLRFSEYGELEVVPEDERRRVLDAPNLPPGPWADLAAWLKTRGPDRTISPRSKVTLRQIAERERDFGTDEDVSGTTESLESALRYDPTVPLARMMLANVLERTERDRPEDQRDAAVFARAAHWRRYDLDRLPNDPNLWERAAEILQEAPEGAMVGVGPQPITASEAAKQAEKKATR